MKKLSARAYFFKKMLDCFIGGLFAVLLLFVWTLYKGPVSVPFLKPYIVQALNYDENDYTIDIGDVNIEFVRSIQPLRVTANNISLKKKDDTINVKSPKLYLSFSLRALLKGIIAPSDVRLINPTAYIFASYGVDEQQENQINKKKLQFYIEKFKEFLQRYNSLDKIYPESYVNNIAITSGELEFHEVELGRKWILSDINLEFSRNLVNLEANANALININDKIASAGFEGKYHSTDDKLNVEIYFSDLILSDVMSTFNETTEDNMLTSMSIEVPVNGKVDFTVDLAEMLQHPHEAEDYIDGAVESIGFEIDGDHGYIAFEGDEKYNYEIDNMQLSGEVKGGVDELYIKNAKLKLGGQDAQISFQASGLETYYLEHSLQDMAMRLQANVADFPLSELSNFWPRYFAEPAWQWCKESLIGGHAKNADFVFDFGYRKQTDTWGLINLRGKAELNDGDLYYLEGMPLVHNVYGTAYFSPQNIKINIDKGISDGVIITGGFVDIYDLHKEDNFISINLIGNSEVSQALTLIDHKPLEFTSAMGLRPQDVKGNVDVKLKLDFELRQDLNPDDIKVDVLADLQQIKISNLIPEHSLGADNMQLKVNSSGWSLQGDALYDEVPVKFAMKEEFAEKKYKSKCNVTFKLDDTTKQKLGMDWKIFSAPSMEGIALVNADVIVQNDDSIDIAMKADLAATKLNYPYLSIAKNIDEPAEIKAKVILQKDKLLGISDISFHQPGFVIEGNVSTYPSGRVKIADISKLSGAKTSARAKVSLTDSDTPQIKIDISGNSYDLRAIFDKTAVEKNKANQIRQENEDDGVEKVNNTDVFMAVNSLWTNDTTPIKNFAGSAKLRHGIGIHELHMVGNYGRDKSIKLNLDYVPRGENEHYLSVDSNNAGSTLKVLRLYDNMVGGILKIEARRMADKKFIGHASVRDFSVQNAPVMAQLLSVASFSGMLDLLKGDGLTFTHFNAPFEYQYKILQLNHAKAEGNVVGITANGQYNRASDDIRLKGVIAPAYSLNRFLGKIPVVGNLLASKDGTIFAADYKINGSTDNPEIDINSLSILSPNSMKEWYNENFGDDDEL